MRNMSSSSNKGWTGMSPYPSGCESLNVNMSSKKGFLGKQVDYVYIKCKNEEVIGTEQVNECKISYEENSDSNRSSCKCPVLTIVNYTVSILSVLK